MVNRGNPSRLRPVRLWTLPALKRMMDRMKRAFIAISAVVAFSAHAADPAQGKQLVDEKKCEGCHATKTMGDAKAVYLRKDRKVTTPEKLKAQVALCNSELNLQLFPDEEEHIVAFLDKTYYRFSASAAPAPSPGPGRTR